jgi:hypothetical protein
MDSPKPPETNDSEMCVEKTHSNNVTALLGGYQEICKSHGAIDEFRMKLLGLLPLASLAGIFFVGKADTLATPDVTTPNLLTAFIGVFAATFTMALFLYEIRGILMCSELVCSGCALERRLGIEGQFLARQRSHQKWQPVNAISAACVVYSVVFAAWLFLGLHGFGFRIKHCALVALTVGIVLAALMVLVVNMLVRTVEEAAKPSKAAANAQATRKTTVLSQTTSSPAGAK